MPKVTQASPFQSPDADLQLTNPKETRVILLLGKHYSQLHSSKPHPRPPCLAPSRLAAESSPVLTTDTGGAAHVVWGARGGGRGRAWGWKYWVLGRVPGEAIWGPEGESRAPETRPRGRGREGSPRPDLGAQPGTSVNTSLRSAIPSVCAPPRGSGGAGGSPAPRRAPRGRRRPGQPRAALSPGRPGPGARGRSAGAARSWAAGQRTPSVDAPPGRCAPRAVASVAAGGAFARPRPRPEVSSGRG